jgi:hypothetical protein
MRPIRHDQGFRPRCQKVHRARSTIRRRFFPWIEGLEDRAVPATVTLTVSSLADVGPGTLHAAIDAADADPANSYVIDFSVTGTIDLFTPLPGLIHTIAIQGPGEGLLSVQRDPGAGPFGIFAVALGANATLSGLTMSHGLTITPALATDPLGGGINNDGTLMLINCTLADNAAQSDFLEDGGAINNNGSLSLTGCTLTSNTSDTCGGAIYNNFFSALTLTNCTLTGNSASGGGAIENDGRPLSLFGCTLTSNTATREGGAIDNHGTLTLTSCTLADNAANSHFFEDGGAINNTGHSSLFGCTLTSNATSGEGGAINGQGGTLTLTSCTLADNAAGGDGGGIVNLGIVTLTRCALVGNSAANGDGGGIISSGTGGFAQAALSGCTLSGNSAGHDGGGLANEDQGSATLLANCTLSGNSAASGGGIFNYLSSAIDVRASTLSANRAGGAGGGIDNAGTLNVSQGTDIDNNAAASGGGLANEAGAQATVGGSHLDLNAAGGAGGGVDNFGTLNVSASTLSANKAGTGGGGLAVERGAAATVTGSTLAGNSAPDGGGAFTSATLTFTACLVSNNSAGAGAGLLNTGYGFLTVSNSTLSGNHSASEGGALLNENSATLTATTIAGNSARSAGGGCSNNATSFGLNLVNCTLANNTAVTGGGALHNYRASILHVANSTIAGNTTTNPGTTGGGIDNFGVLTLFDTIVAMNTAPGTGPNVAGAITSLGHNLVDKPGGGSGFVASDVLGRNPLLAPLGSYGGPTQTMALLPGSPAIDAGDNANAPAIDQRGFARIVHGVIDIGAFESRGFALTVVSGDGQSTPVGTAFGKPLVVAVTSPFGEPVQGGVVTWTAPPTGASTSLVVNTATVGPAGQASVTVTANGVAGGYAVTATAAGTAAPAVFHLTNLAPGTLSHSAVPSATDAVLARWYGEAGAGSLAGSGTRRRGDNV